MKTIKFNDNYPKLHGAKEAVLVGVEQTYLSSIPDALLAYDTTRSDGTAFGFSGNSGDLKILVLLFVSGDMLFTTIRKNNADNAHYMQEIGEKFEIEVITNDKN